MRKLWGTLIAVIVILTAGAAYTTYVLVNSGTPDTEAGTSEEGDVEISITANETNFNITITMSNRGNKSILSPNWAYTYILRYPNGTEFELYRAPANCTSPPITPHGNWSHVDNLYSFLNVKTGKRMLKLPVGEFQLFARYKSKNNPYGLGFPYETTDSNILSLKTENPLKVPYAKTSPNVDGKMEQGEWNDSLFYRYFWRDGGPYSPIVDDSLNVTMALKHDDSNLYVLFIINDEPDIHHMLNLITENRSIYIHQDGKIESDPDDNSNISAEVSYLNNTYIFEIKVKMKIVYGHAVPFNLIYIEDPAKTWNIVPIGGWNNAEPGVIFLEQSRI